MYPTDHGSTNRHGILSLTINNHAALHAVFMPFVENGGRFIPTDKYYELNDEVFMLLNLFSELEKIPLTGKVVWITPPRSEGRRVAGIGVQFKHRKNSAKPKIEDCLAHTVASHCPSHTM